MVKRSFVLGIAVLSLLAASPAMAAPGKGKTPDSNLGKGRIQVVVNLDLVSDEGLIDLESLDGKLRYRAKKGKAQLKTNLKLPLVSTMLGISDAISAAAADIHLEVLREEAPIADCQLQYIGSEEADEDSAGHHLYRLHGKVGPNSKSSGFRKGACVVGESNAVPEMQAGDTIRIYLLGAENVQTSFAHGE